MKYLSRPEGVKYIKFILVVFEVYPWRGVPFEIDMVYQWTSGPIVIGRQ